MIGVSQVESTIKAAKPPKQKALNLLRQQLASVPEIRSKHRKSSEFKTWWRATQSIVGNVFGEDSPQIQKLASIQWFVRRVGPFPTESDFQEDHLNALTDAEAHLRAFVSEIENFWKKETLPKGPKAKDQVLLLLNRFPSVARQLRARHDKRPGWEIIDEYDVQDLLHSMLRIFFDDIRAEEWTPSYAGGSSRMDFLLRQPRIVIEAKKSRHGMTARTVSDELLADILRYKSHPDAKLLVCFIYDPDGLMRNPGGIESDLSKPVDGLEVICVIRPQ